MAELTDAASLEYVASLVSYGLWHRSWGVVAERLGLNQ
ncbi:hypothetical protein DWB77_07373 [Streptomyces hundungensis]|uniref:MarR family transcriptional regulator n=1 Tax=Streptomyces hundungensis TaxID=1077946 RepID=A0A387HMK3_9ACTN|nr:hypothetical protein DWB77_07373 [Streptomyces hundungensis]